MITTDTNSAAAADMIRRFCAPHEIRVHSDLKNPKLLAWTHRKAMKSAFADFDYFLYIEDDILLTPAGINIWLERLPSLVKHDFLPGFLLRVEENRNGELVSSDFSHRTVVMRYYSSTISHTYTPNSLIRPCGFTTEKETMRRFISSDTFESGYPEDANKPLENAALGFTFEHVRETYRRSHGIYCRSQVQ